MNNPFDAIEQRLIRIEEAVRSLQHPAPIVFENKEEKPLTQSEAAKFLGKTRQTIYSWRKEGHIKAYKIGGRIYFKPSELIAALQKCELK